MSCKQHPKYLGIHKPTADCKQCKAIYAQELYKGRSGGHYDNGAGEKALREWGDQNRFTSGRYEGVGGPIRSDGGKVAKRGGA